MSDTPRTDALEQSGTAHYTALAFAGQLERELNAAKASRCEWKEDIDGNWDTSCKQCMSFEYDPPAEQGYKFCHHCGATINFIKWTEEDQDS